MEEHHVTERRACRVLHVNRTAYRYQVIRLPDEDDVRAKVIQLVASYGRVGYRMVTAMMNNSGTIINHMLTDYMSMMTRYTETMEKLDAIDEDTLSTAENAYYLEVMLRINAKLAAAI